MDYLTPTTIWNLSTNNNQDTPHFTLTLPDLTAINVLAVYAPSKDNPIGFLNSVHNISNQGQAEHRIILGDFNCTFNHDMDSSGYESDPHPKSRKDFNSLIDNQKFVDSFRHYHPNKTKYTYRAFRKDKCDLRGRLDYGFISPSLLPYLKKVSHTAQNYDVTDHATYYISLDITESKRGKGIFRCSPTMHKDIEYQRLIRNTIRQSVYDSLKETPSIKLTEALFHSRILL
jgi:exonuclease III